MMGTYIAGPMRSFRAFNHPAFDECAAYLRAQGGHEPLFVPSEKDRERGFDFDDSYKGTMEELIAVGFPLEGSMAADLQFIVSNDCDLVVMLPGWARSFGATRERNVAIAAGKKVAYFAPLVGGS
jgi:hypothetical protein